MGEPDEMSVVVSQADRNAAVRLLEAGGQDWQAKEIRLGQADHFPLVQAFARHRTEALSSLLADKERLEAELADWRNSVDATVNLARRAEAAEAKLTSLREALENLMASSGARGTYDARKYYDAKIAAEERGDAQPIDPSSNIDFHGGE